MRGSREAMTKDCTGDIREAATAGLVAKRRQHIAAGVSPQIASLRYP